MRRLILCAAVVVLIGVGQADGATLVKSNTTTGYFDSSFGTRSIAFTAADLGAELYIADIDVTVDFAKDSSNTYVPPDVLPVPAGSPYFDEINFTLTGPSGTSVTLIDNTGINNGSFNSGAFGSYFQGSLTFDQSAALPVNFDRNQITPGTFLPATDGGNLDSFHYENAVGTWSLFIEDDDNSDGLSFYGYSIEINTIPEPSAFIMLAMGAVGVLAYAWRRKRVS